MIAAELGKTSSSGNDDMGLSVCPASGPLDFESACVRAAWTSLLPAALVVLLVVFRLPVTLPGHLSRLISAIQSPFHRFLTLDEAEALLYGSADSTQDASATGESDAQQQTTRSPLWRTIALASISILEAVAWLGSGAAHLVIAHHSDDIKSFTTWSPFLIALTWLYSALRLVLKPQPTPSYDLFTLWLLHFVGATLSIGVVLYDRAAYDMPWPSNSPMFALVANFVAVSFLLINMLSLPLAIPSKYVDASQIGKRISPEDYTSLWGWVSFHWVGPLIKKGTNATLNEKDVWVLSPTMQSKAVFLAFSTVKRLTLLRRLWAANSLDMILDAGLTITSVVLNYMGPYFLKNILQAIGPDSTPEARAKAYVYAFLTFLASALKSEADLIHLWHGRRACTRIRSALMAAIYEKALKRKDFSGIVQQKDEADAAISQMLGNGEAKKPKAKAEKNKKKEKSTSGADIGKIVQLMSGDANRIGNTISGMYFIYGAPFEIIIAATFLYQLMGITAFAGFAVLLVVSPLNNYLSRRRIRIQRELLVARDKRMGVLNELIAEAKFIKLFAWESQWIERALKARQYELGKLIKSSINSLWFSLVWSSAPALVCIISFLAFILSGRELTVPIAFTALALFRMMSSPLNIIPTWIVQMLEAGVALERIATFLEEDEVSALASSLKRNATSAPRGDYTLGIQHGSFKWNELSEKKEDIPESRPRWRWSRSSFASTASTDYGSTAETIVSQDRVPFELRDISIIFPTGKLTVVTGPTASGKTALLNALLGEMTETSTIAKVFLPKDKTTVDEDGYYNAVSLCVQRPWLQHLSIRDNILFGSPFEKDRYDQVLECCALKPDLKIFEDGDQTEIGVRGVSLSGGQKARVALARAVYQRTKHVLLDDPLSAVDSHTARFLFEKLFCGPLMVNRTVVLVTHHVDLVLPGAHHLVRMLDGRIDVSGTVADLKANGHLAEITHDAAAEAEAHKSESPATPGDAVDEPETAVTKDKKRARQLIKEEARAEGSVKWSIYRTYIAASSYTVWVLVVILILLGQLLFVAERLWIKVWGEAYGDAEYATRSHSWSFLPSSVAHSASHAIHGPGLSTQANVMNINLPPANERPMFYVAVFAAITLGGAFVNVLTGAVQLVGSYMAGKRLFRKLLVAVIRAPFRWHDTTPSGRLLNRFSKDMETVDSSLSGSLRAVTSQLAGFIAAVLTIGWILPGFLVPAALIAYLYWKLAIGYLNTGRDLRRLESNARSPIFAGFAEMLEGITTIRGFSMESSFLNNLHHKIDVTTQMWYSFWMMNRWLLLRFDLLGALAVLVTTLFGLAAIESVGYAGWAGVTITSAMSLTASIYWCCRFITQLELDLNSVERVVEYLDVPSEPPAIIENNRPPAYWPSSDNSEALISVENLSIRYAQDLPHVLHNLSFNLKARERVGLLGRTGSGKSTLAMSLLRFTDPTEGRIVIDGIDISTIGVQDLRSRITIIPQDSALFSGTLRDNLDPFNNYSDEECLEALRRVHLITDSAPQSTRASRAASIIEGVEGPNSETSSVTHVMESSESTTSKKLSLDSPVSAGGANFSQGQRQLLALARALLRQSSIIIFDEATSSIDFKSDARIQATIREEFRNSLLLTVAHRLRTIIDFDRVIVLDQGNMVEFDTPFNLIRKEGGYFRQLCLQSGSFKDLELAATAKAKADGVI